MIALYLAVAATEALALALLVLIAISLWKQRGPQRPDDGGGAE